MMHFPCKPCCAMASPVPAPKCAPKPAPEHVQKFGMQYMNGKGFTAEHLSCVYSYLVVFRFSALQCLACGPCHRDGNLTGLLQ